MKIVKTVVQLQETLAPYREKKSTIGLVPTMGALHVGHASLIDRSVEENEITVVSLFVNPTQFNNSNDLESYPRTFDADCELLESHGATILFAPSVKEIYPEKDNRIFNYAPIDSVMEGAMRPGHFNGVCQIVSKLFYAVKPIHAYFGEKDFQQLAVIRCMVKDLKLPIKIVGCPIVREKSGLAFSSRNARLTEKQRNLAIKISAVLRESINFAASNGVVETKQFVEDAIAAAEGLEIEYFEIVDGRTMQTISSWDDTDYVMGCITVFCGEVRLIDNICYRGQAY